MCLEEEKELFSAITTTWWMKGNIEFFFIYLFFLELNFLGKLKVLSGEEKIMYLRFKKQILLFEIWTAGLFYFLVAWCWLMNKLIGAIVPVDYLLLIT